MAGKFKRVEGKTEKPEVVVDGKMDDKMKGNEKLPSKYFRLLRPLAWVCFLLPLALGFAFLASPSTKPLNVVLGFASAIFWMSFSFTINALYDRDVDRFHDGRMKDLRLAYQPLVTGEISVVEGKILCIVFFALSILLAYLVNFEFFLSMLGANIVGYVYSAPPRFKTKPVMDIVSNALAGVFAFHAGMAINDANIFALSPEMDIAIFLLAATLYIPTAVSDYEFDRLAGFRNTPVFFSPEKSLKAMYPLGFLTAIAWCYAFMRFNLFEIRSLTPFVLGYLAVYVKLANSRWDGKKLNISPAFILVPFTASFVFSIAYGILSMLGVITL